MILGLLLSSAHGQPVLLDFEDLPAGTGVFRHYPGVTFQGGDANPPLTRIVRPDLGALSGELAVQGRRVGELSGSGITMVFDSGDLSKGNGAMYACHT